MSEGRTSPAGPRVKVPHLGAVGMPACVPQDGVYELGDANPHKPALMVWTRVADRMRLLQKMPTSNTNAEVYIDSVIKARPPQDALKTLSRRSQDALKTLGIFDVRYNIGYRPSDGGFVALGQDPRVREAQQA